MSDPFRESAERCFLEGLSAARGGLGEESCPYEFLPVTSEVSTATTSPLDWMAGWRFGRFTMMQALRKERANALQSAVQQLTRYQRDYSDACRVSHEGILRSRFKSIAANKRSNEIAARIKASTEFKLLRDLQYEFYLPWRQSEAPYEFKLFDRVLGFNPRHDGALWGLLKEYGDRHGVQAAWTEYVQAEPLRLPPL